MEVDYSFTVPRSRVFSTEAIILRRVDQGEADRLVTLLTPARGKLRVMARGARKITSRKAGHIELFTRASLMLAHGNAIDTISAAELIEPYIQLRDDVVRGGLAHYLCEMAEMFAQEEQADAALFNLLADGLGWLCGARDPALAARYFEMRLLTLAGYHPQLAYCALSGAPLEADYLPADQQRGTPFSALEGGALCRAALGQAHEWTTLSYSALQLLRVMQAGDYGVLEPLEVTRDVHLEIERALQAYLSFVTERRARSARHIRSMAS